MLHMHVYKLVSGSHHEVIASECFKASSFCRLQYSAVQKLGWRAWNEARLVSSAEVLTIQIV